MFELGETLAGWRRDGRRVALATVVGTSFSAPLPPGSALAVDDRGAVAGAVSGGCVEADVYEAARGALADGRPRLAGYGISNAQAFEFGLICGGTIEIFVEPLPPGEAVGAVAAALERDESIALATLLNGAAAGAKLALGSGGRAGTLGSEDLDRAVEREALALLGRGGTLRRSFGESDVFVQARTARPELLIFGAVEIARALATIGKYAGYRVVAIDARPVFATRARVPDADEIVVMWPDEYLASRRVDARTALVVLTHDAKFDIPLLEIALRSEAGYIGAMGSRRTHAERIALLRERGFGDADFARINAPIGLDISASTPEETAISIAAEIIAVRSGRDGGRLRDAAHPIHADAIAT